MYTEPDAKERLLPKKARGAANEITSLRMALLFDKNETLKERDLLDPADDFALTELCEIQKDFSLQEPLILTWTETSASPIPVPNTVMCTLPVVGGDKAETEDTATRSVFMSDKKLPTLPDCVIDNGMMAALIA